MRLISILIAILLLTSVSQAGQMITQNNPVAFWFDSFKQEENGTMTVYISDYMMPNPEPGINFVQVVDCMGCGCE